MHLLFTGACSQLHPWKSMKGTGSVVKGGGIGLILYDFGPVKGFRQLRLSSSLWACFLLDPFNAFSCSHLPLSWPPSPQPWGSCLCTRGAAVPSGFPYSIVHAGEAEHSQESSLRLDEFRMALSQARAPCSSFSHSFLCLQACISTPPTQYLTSPLNTGTTKNSCLICSSQWSPGACWIQPRRMRMIHRLLLVR